MDSDFYVEFENNFRGSREQIINVLANYDGLIDYILSIDKNPSLLDIGSGRGEWIQKCNAKGFKSIGIELDSRMVKDCKNLNLNIKQGDALSLLDDFHEDSFSIVSAFHVIEHMNYANIDELLIKCKRILKPDGLLILETPSIDNLIVASKSFHIDPTHINPIHADLLAFMVKRTGFTTVECYFINGGPLQNSEADLLTRVFNGVAQDIVLIATKSNLLDNSNFDNINLIKRDMNTGITTLQAAIDFDNCSRNHIAQYDEAIFIMRKRIIALERQLEHYINLYNRSPISILVKIPSKIKSLFLNFKNKIKNKLRSFLRYLFNRKVYIIFIKRIYKIQYLFYILRYLEKLLDRLGVRIYKYKFVKKSKKEKEDFDLVLKHDIYLLNYFNASEDSKSILQDLKKYS
tara:strand:- start:96 stop:1307 length:1212 start_codon:yes stop_codon:yes gene_type:complete